MADTPGMTETPFETELWLLALSWRSGLYWELMWPGFDDVVNRMVAACHAVALGDRALDASPLGAVERW